MELAEGRKRAQESDFANTVFCAISPSLFDLSLAACLVMEFPVAHRGVRAAFAL